MAEEDLQLTIAISETNPTLGDVVSINAIIENTGTSSTAFLTKFNDNTTLLYTSPVVTLNAGASTTVSIDYETTQTGARELCVEAKCPQHPFLLFNSVEETPGTRTGLRNHGRGGKLDSRLVLQ